MIVVFFFSSQRLGHSGKKISEFSQPESVTSSDALLLSSRRLVGTRPFSEYDCVTDCKDTSFINHVLRKVDPVQILTDSHLKYCLRHSFKDF